MPGCSLSHRILFISSILLLIVSIVTLCLTGHAKWLLVRYFPADAWYIWRGTDDTYDEQQTTQQWIAVAYNETYDRLALVRAVLGVVASVLSIWIMRAKPRAVMEEDTQNFQNSFRGKPIYITAVVLAVISFASTLTSAIWSSILHYQSSKRCQIPTVLAKYNNNFKCTRELATCVMLPVIRKTDDAARRLACVETKTTRWLLVPMLALGLALVVGYAVQIWYLRRRAALEQRAEDKVTVLEKAD
ncbi:hypothetical protein BKA58DRAFT_226212 [Alternaria rosae]|uniref:uncharacterized protein n=1 Tax=Alternaria rosae TaxID=1187941 RepID=UPI001E8E7E4A|nr:uncharacterized protein BKA58DRAFT_226212 [Alternaria rosae]KAH6865725.1 hypothetical protein BKA58DRAFT_226212 [Alternaria rosae]